MIKLTKECYSDLFSELPQNTLFNVERKGNKIIFNDLVSKEVSEFENNFILAFNLRQKLKGIIINNEFTLVRTAHVHTHSTYSLLDGQSKINDIVELTEYGSAITDHGVMFGVVDFYKTAKEVSKKPIIGVEVYTEGIGEENVPQDKKNKYHLILLAKNITGYYNIAKMCSLAYNNIGGKFPKRPLVTHEQLKNYSEGVIALSACISGEVSKTILNKGKEETKKVIETLSSYFEKGDFYLEIQRHEMEEEAIYNPILIELSKEMGVKLVATADSHYTKKEDNISHEVLLCINRQKTLSDPTRFKFSGTNYHYLNSDEFERLFFDIPEALDTQLEIVEKCNVEIPLGELYLPKFDIPEEFQTDNDYLRYLSEKGFKERFTNFEKWDESKQKVYNDRLNYEIGVITNMGFSSYFLIVQDFINYAKLNDIPVGPGRGSAAGSLMSYCLGITNIDPIPFDLLFERFLNPERVSWPDIDIDFCYERRDEVIQYVVNKYGQDCVANITTFGTLSAKSVVRDVAKVMGRTINTGYSYNMSDKLAKAIPNELKMTLGKALQESPDFKDYYENDEDAKEVIDIAMSLEKNHRHSSIHACGIPITSKPIYEIMACYKTGDSDMWITQYPMAQVEELGALKMDFLGLKTLTVIYKALQLINPKRIKQGLKPIQYQDIPLDDVEVYKFIATGNTVGVFQLESPGMQNFMKELYQDIHLVSKDRGIEMFERLIAGVSLYRPGPMDSIPTYIKNMNNPNDIEYSTEYLKPILEPTYGCIVYQEQVMRIVQDLAGYSLGRADLIRRAMGKKKMDVMEKEKHNFIYGLPNEGVEGCVAKGIPVDVATAIFDDMIDFAKYAFNKSHAAVYAMLGVITAWLKKYYPIEFSIGTLNTYINVTEDLKYYISDIKKQNIKILPPSVNYSEEFFIEEGDSIRFALKGLKGVNNCSSIINDRKNHGNFTDFQSLAERLNQYEKVNKKILEALVYSSALDEFEGTRAGKIEMIPIILNSFSIQKKKNIEGQISMFDISNETFEEIATTMQVQIPNIQEFERLYKLSKEKEVTNLYLSEHPLDNYISMLKAEKILDIASYKIEEDDKELEEYKLNELDGIKVKFAGILNEVTKRYTKKNDTMFTFVLEDLSGEIKAVIFPKQLRYIDNSLLENDKLVIIEGTLSYGDFGLQLIVDKMVDIEVVKKQEEVKRVWILINQTYQINQVNDMLKKYKGNTPLYGKIMINGKERKEHLGSFDCCLGAINTLKNITNNIHMVTK